jgi:nitrate/nitrite-specific signal transduction histidine kinase
LRNKLIRNLNARYVFVLASLAVLSVTSYLILGQVIDRQESSAATINIAGRQRIALLGVELDRLREGPERRAVRERYGEALSRLAEEHRALIDGDPGLGVQPPQSEALRALYFGPEAFVDRDMREFVARARNLLALHGDRAPR